MSSVLFSKVKARELITNRIQSRGPLSLCFEQYYQSGNWRTNLPSIEELACFKVRVWRNEESIILQISPERTTSVFFPEINHAPTRLTFNHLPVPLVEAFGDISTFHQSEERCLEKFNAFSAYTTDQDGRHLSKLKEAAGKCAHWLHRFTRPRAHAASTPARDWLRGSGDLRPSHRLLVESDAFLASVFVE